MSEEVVLISGVLSETYEARQRPVWRLTDDSGKVFILLVTEGLQRRFTPLRNTRISIAGYYRGAHRFAEQLFEIVGYSENAKL